MKLNRKGITLETAVSLILVAVSLGIIIILLFTSGLISSLSASICTILTTASSYVRGFVVYAIWTFYGILIGLVAAIMFLLGRTCQTFPFGTAACLITFGVFVVILTGAFTALASSLPLLSCPNPTIIHGFKETCGNGVSNETFIREVADRTVDCWNMYTAGKYDPLSGREPPNPVTCFVVDFNVKTPVSMRNITEWMIKTNYSSDGTKYLAKVGGVIPQNNNEEIFNNEYTKGRLFIKYGDDQTLAKWGSADCNIDSTFVVPNRTTFFKELSEEWGVGVLISPPAIMIKSAFDTLTSTKDYVYWCIDRDISCDKTCHTQLTTEAVNVMCINEGTCNCDLRWSFGNPANILLNFIGLNGGTLKLYNCPAGITPDCSPTDKCKVPPTTEVPCVTG
jgi:hypothetical protein